MPMVSSSLMSHGNNGTRYPRHEIMNRPSACRQRNSQFPFSEARGNTWSSFVRYCTLRTTGGLEDGPFLAFRDYRQQFGLADGVVADFADVGCKFSDSQHDNSPEEGA